MPKMLNATITDEADVLLKEIKKVKGFANNAEALDWIIKHVGKELLKKQVRDKAIELGVKGAFIHD